MSKENEIEIIVRYNTADIRVGNYVSREKLPFMQKVAGFITSEGTPIEIEELAKK